MKEVSTNHARPDQTRQRGGRVITIDWRQIHQKLEGAQAAVERGISLDPREIQSILRKRAKVLAKEPEGGEASGASLEVVEFLLAHEHYEHYAIGLRWIREIQSLRDLTPLPCTPPFVLGLTNVRGQILSVIDIKKFFDLPEKGLTELNKVVVVRTNRVELAILADDVLGVRSIGLRDLQPCLPTFTGVRAEFVRGVTKDSAVVLDVERILSDGRILVDEDASSVIRSARTSDKEMS
jgi:purine-binding chemotaxis protein CheW